MLASAERPQSEPDESSEEQDDRGASINDPEPEEQDPESLPASDS